MTLLGSESILATHLAAIEHAETHNAASPRPDDSWRQPVHTFYGGAHLFRAETPQRLGAIALGMFERYAPDPAHVFSALFDASTGDRKNLAGPTSDEPTGEDQTGEDPTDRGATAREAIYEKICHKLRHEPIEDLRIDFEDGYGQRSDDEEDGHAKSTARASAHAFLHGTLPPFFGLRIKPFASGLSRRALRTLDLFLTHFSEVSGGQLPPTFVVTLAKVTSAAQVALLTEALARWEQALGRPTRSLHLEIMIESPQALLDAHGVCPLPAFLAAAAGRMRGAHFGAYDYLSACSISAPHQNLLHPACDFARSMMQAAYGATPLFLCDGVTTTLPVAPHAIPPHGTLDETKLLANRQAVHRAWRLHTTHIAHALTQGFYQGWDVHPAQLPARYAAVYRFFHEQRHQATERLQRFRHEAERAVRTGTTFDDAATGRGLETFFRRGFACGALTADEAMMTPARGEPSDP